MRRFMRDIKFEGCFLIYQRHLEGKWNIWQIGTSRKTAGCPNFKSEIVRIIILYNNIRQCKLDQG